MQVCAVKLSYRAITTFYALCIIGASHAEKNVLRPGVFTGPTGELVGLPDTQSGVKGLFGQVPDNSWGDGPPFRSAVIPKDRYDYG